MISDTVGALNAREASIHLANILDAALRPESEGAVGDGVHDDYPAWQAIAAKINARGGGRVECRAGAVYRWDRYRIDAGAEANGVTNISFQDCSGLVIAGNGARIECKGDFVRTDDGGGVSYRNTLGFSFTRCDALEITGLEVDGNSDQTTKDAAAEGYAHGLSIQGCERVTLKRLYLHHFPSDGLNIRDDGAIPTARATKRLTAEDVLCDYNGRQGCSITGLRWAHFTRCQFSNTGRSSYGYHSPAGGIDFEPDRYPGHVNPLLQSDTSSGDVQFSACTFQNNVGSEFVGSGAELATIYPVRFDACDFIGAPAEASRVIHSMRHVSFTGCLFKDIEFKPAWAAASTVKESTHVDRCIFENAEPGQSVVRWLRNSGAEYSSLVIENSTFRLTAPSVSTVTARIYCAATGAARLRFVNNRIAVAGTEHDGVTTDTVAHLEGSYAEGNEWTSDLATGGGLFFAISYSNATVRGDRFASLSAFSPTGAVYAEEYFDQGRAGAGVLEVGDGTWTSAKRKLCFRTAAPTTGAWLKGDTVLNSNPANADSTMGWRCTVAGTPGTWTTLHRISMVEAAAQADSVAADVATLKTDFNALLAKLRTAKLLG